MARRMEIGDILASRAMKQAYEMARRCRRPRADIRAADSAKRIVVQCVPTTNGSAGPDVSNLRGEIQCRSSESAHKLQEKGRQDYFTGTVLLDMLFDSPTPHGVVGAQVTFEPAAHGLAYAPARAERSL